jgi:glycosyltransferase involved in cell wall biosynthesis
MKNNSSVKILIHHHGLAYLDGETIWVQSFLGRWILALSELFSCVGILFTTVDSKLKILDTPLKKSNIKLEPFGKAINRRMSTSTNILEQTIKKVSLNYDILLIRGITPRQYLVFKNAQCKTKCFLLVGSIKASKPKFKFNILRLFLIYRYYYHIRTLSKIAKKSQVFANSPDVVKELNSFLNISSIYIPTNTISLNEIPAYHSFIPKNETNWVFCGRIVQDKGVEELIDALSLYNKKGYLANLTFIGKGSDTYISLLKNKIDNYKLNSHVSFIGFKEFGKDLFTAYLACDIFILPSWHEGFPHSIWEAAACSLPIIVTSVGGIPGVVNSEQVTFVEVRNPEMICDACIDILNNPELVNKKTKNIYDLSKSYTVEECVNQLHKGINLES